MRTSYHRLGAALLLAAAAGLTACGADRHMAPFEPDTTRHEPAADTTPLRVYGDARGRWIGAATGTMLTMPGDSGALLRRIAAREFSMLWTGTFMKFDFLRPSRSTYNYAQADSVVAFAQRNGMVVRGHTLVWHQQIPAWVTSGGYPPDTLAAILRDHIEQVMAHFRGKLVAWDVVNEAMGDDATLRPTLWLDALGPDYIAQAFRWARAADPDVPLYYNDYNIETANAKSDAVYRMLADLKARGVPIDGIGFQFHYQADAAPTADEIASNFARFAALGLKIQITEADMHVRVQNGVASAADLQVQATAYRNLVTACLRTPACNAIEIEGIYDGQAWVPDPANWGAPVLFDIHVQPKPAYYAVKAALATP
ncbi:MAG: endo-1,4-beta-xylanase [Gemmatimonadetes bacterium]|nr:endo-1,4-beta-xylanase [Gemmatimonadota bacterium]